MNKTFLSAAFVFLMGALFAQNESEPLVPKSAKDFVVAPANTSDDPMDKASWKKNEKNDKAELSGKTGHGSKKQNITYDATGDAVISEDSQNTNSSDAYPPAVAEYYTQKYPGEKFKVRWSKDKIGNKQYYINRKSEVFWFDQSGQFKSKTKNDPK